MTMRTEDLIARLAAEAQPVRRLYSPAMRTLIWFAMALSYATAIVLLHGGTPVAGRSMHFLVEQAATFATALASAFAAFAVSVPGYDRRVLLLPLPPVALWLATVGYGCVTDWLQFGPEGLAIRPDWDCLLPAVLIGILPAAALVFLLRRGAPLQPRLTLALAGLATAALANLGLQFFHARDASIMVLTWHLGGAAVLALLGSLFGRRLLGWRDVAP